MVEYEYVDCGDGIEHVVIYKNDIKYFEKKLFWCIQRTLNHFLWKFKSDFENHLNKYWRNKIFTLYSDDDRYIIYFNFHQYFLYYFNSNIFNYLIGKIIKYSYLKLMKKILIIILYLIMKKRIIIFIFMIDIH